MSTFVEQLRDLLNKNNMTPEEALSALRKEEVEKLKLQGINDDGVTRANLYAENYNMTKDIKHKLNYTYLRAENTKTHTDLTYKPMHTLNYVLSVSPIKQLKVTADVSYVTTTLCETGDYLKDYCLVSARADYQIMEYVSLWVKGDNLTNDEKYQLSYDYPMPGITGTDGIDVRF